MEGILFPLNGEESGLGPDRGERFEGSYSAPDSRLSSSHLGLIKGSAISAEVSRERGYRTETVKAHLYTLGFSPIQCRTPALLVPLWNVRGECAGYQLRPDQPRIKNGKMVKYETPRGLRMMLDCPRRCRAMLGDPAIPLFVTEGVRKADSAASHGLCCVALLGVWNWRGSNEHGGKTALADWELIALNRRTAYIAFDSDAMEKRGVYEALARLKSFLESRSVVVRLIYLPPARRGGKVGLDDFFAAGHRTEDLFSCATDHLRELPSTVRHSQGPYRETASGLVWVKNTRDGESEVQLTNFLARIIADVRLDDGVQSTKAFVIEGVIDGRARRFSIAASQFGAMNWPVEELGAGAVISAGMGAKDRTREAIQRLSPEIVERDVFSHTGWRKKDDAWVYLHLGGAVGADSVVWAIETNLPPALAPFVLPSPPSGEALVRAVHASLRIPRGLIVSTGEDLPTGQSLRARMLIMAVAPGDVDRDKLGACQSDAAAGCYAQALAGYLRWLAPMLRRIDWRASQWGKTTPASSSLPEATGRLR